MGLHRFTLPNFVLGHSIFGGSSAEGAGITVSTEFNAHVGATLFWARPENDNTTNLTGTGDYGKKYGYSDTLDFIGFSLPMSFDGITVTPWGGTVFIMQVR